MRDRPRAARRHARRAGRADPEFRTGDDPEPASQARLFEALLALLERLGRDRPIALVLEDLHWADPSTRDFLVFLVRSARTEALCLLVTYRSDELHRRHPLRPVLAELERVPGVQRIAVERFSRAEVAAQLAGILDGPPRTTSTDRLYARGQGNPLYTEELLAASADGCSELPETLRDALLGRFERLPAAAQEVVRIAAVVERPMAPCAARDGEHAAGGRRARGRARGRRPPGPRQPPRRHVRVPPRLVGEAIFEDLLPGERTALHAASRRGVLEPTPRCSDDLPPATLAAELACHWRAAHDLPRALGAARRGRRRRPPRVRL